MKYATQQIILVLSILCLIVYFSSCQKEDKLSALESDKTHPEIPENISELIEQGSKKNGYFVYPYNGQKLDRDGNYIMKANRNSTSSRYAILLLQNGNTAWNNYWGREGTDGMFYLTPSDPEYFNFRLGKASVLIWHYTNSRWQYKSAITINLYHNWAQPVLTANQITSLCGWRSLNSGIDCHSGMDIGHSLGGGEVLGDNVRAVAAGRVVESDLGNLGSVTIEHNGGRYSTRYRHLNSIRSSVRVGRTVNKGQIIGQLGENGAPNMPHLHFEYYFGVQHERFIGNEDAYYDCPLANFCYVNPTSISRVNNDNDVNMSLTAYCNSIDHFGRYCN